VINGAGSNSVTLTDYITVHPQALAVFVYTVNGLTVDFTNNSENADSYFWEFGDNTTSKEASPTHKYRFSGNYTVKLMVIRGDEKLETTKNVVIDAPDAECIVELETKFGNLTIKLYNETPKHRDNFIKLVATRNTKQNWRRSPKL